MVHVLYAVAAFTCALVTLILPFRVYKELKNSDEAGRIFLFLTRWITLFCLVDGTWGILASDVVMNDTLLFLFSALFHTCAAITPLMWLLFVLAYLKKLKEGRLFLVSGIALTVAELVMILINFSNRMMFYVTEEGTYTSTPVRKILFYLQYAIYVFIAVYAIVNRFKGEVFKERRNPEKARKNFTAVLMFVLAPIVLGVFQMIYPDAPAYSIGYMLGVCVIYSFVLTDMLQQRMMEQLKAEAASVAKSDFLFNMSHDIRTPMNAILGYTDIGLRHLSNPSRTEENLQKIKVAGEHMLSIINDILEMSRIEAGRLSLNPAPMDVGEALAEVEQLTRTLAIPRSIAFYMKTDVTRPYIRADRVHINEMLINLLSNAVKYTPVGGRVVCKVEETGETSEGKVTYRFTVSDTGIGMSPEFCKHIFEPFSREQNATTSGVQGTGLGLSIVKNIVDLAGGTIQVESAPGQGTSFTVEMSFPEASDEEKQELKSAKEIIHATDLSLTGKKVLLVEDNDMNREIGTEILTESGMEVDIAQDGEIALETVIAKGIGHYDFILMDIQMPIMNGYEATKAIRALPNGDSVPIIALSANAFKEDIEKSLASGMNAHVAKPIHIPELMETLKRMEKKQNPSAIGNP